MIDPLERWRRYGEKPDYAGPVSFGGAPYTQDPAHLAGFVQESAWREDHRRDPNGAQVDRVVALAMRNKPSVDFCGYWQRNWIN